MRVRELLIRTLRENPKGAELPSHIFLIRGGYIQQVSSGLYSSLPLGKRVLQKITQIIREEMNAISGQEIDLPLVQPSELWKESGRYTAIGAELCRFKDRGEHEMVLAMTHEEAVTHMAREMVSSYKQLPFMVYQFQLKFRDEPRARGGLIRVREFVMKDAYSFHASNGDLDQYYEKARQAYLNIFSRVGLEPVVVQSDTGIMGGKVAHEFMAVAEHGEDYLILSEDGTYSANQEIAVFDRESVKSEPLPLEKVATPHKKTIEEVTGFLGINSRQTMKAVFFDLNGTLVVVFLRGDLNCSEVKVRNFLKTPTIIPAEETLIKKSGFVPGYAGPLGIHEGNQLKVLVDFSILEGNNFVGGANEEGFHLKNLCWERDFTFSHKGDFAQAEGGHKNLKSDSRLKAVRGVEIGNIFKLGTKFTESMNAQFLDSSGNSKPMVMGCYGIGIGRLMASVVEASHDEFGPIWPKSIAPFQILLVSIGGENTVVQTAERLYQDLSQKGFEVLLDDRDERPGVKFKDGDLWGIPLRITLSSKSLAQNSCEWKPRNQTNFEMVALDQMETKLTQFFGDQR